MVMENFDFMKKFDPQSNCIKEFNFWIICARKKSCTLGSAVILLKRKTDSVSNLAPEESYEFPQVIKWYEETCKKHFGAIKFNYFMLMMKDNFVHYHAFPRYKEDVKKFNKVWKDSHWPLMVQPKDFEVLDNTMIKNVIHCMNS